MMHHDANVKSEPYLSIEMPHSPATEDIWLVNGHGHNYTISNWPLAKAMLQNRNDECMIDIRIQKELALR